MTLGELIAEVRVKVKEPTQNHFTDDMLIGWINEGQWQLVSKVNTLLEGIAETVTVPRIGEYPIPENFLRPRLVRWDRYVLRPMSLEARESNPMLIGVPTHYYIWRRSIFLWPEPDSAKALRVWYYRWPNRLVLLDDVPEIPQYLHAALASFACYQIKLSDGSLAESNEYLTEFFRYVTDAERAYSEKQAQAYKVRDVEAEEIYYPWPLLL